jgi:outer membrane protein OmpA-like peptidoglycan-associated protein
VKENKALSIRRASKIYDELIKLKVPQSLLEKDGLGASQPAVKNAKSDEEHQKNRRVEIIKMEGVR